MTIKITPIGSCRIHNPLKKFVSTYYLQLNTSDVYGFTHTSAEALQQIKYLQGTYLPSDAVRPILSTRLRFNKDNIHQITPPADLYFVEISSAKTVMVKDEYVQINYIYVYFSEFFLDPHRSKKFWSLAARPDRESLLTFLKETPCYNAYPKEKQALLANISVKQMTEDELKQDMMAIRDSLKHVVFMTHCNVTLPDMTVIHSREQWIKTIEKVGKEIGVKVYNPTHLMMVLGQSMCLQKNGLDSTHYTAFFERQIFNDVYRLYIEPQLNGLHRIEESLDDKNVPTNELNQIETLYGQGELTLALQQLNTTIRKYPHFSAAKELHGRILYQLHDFERVISIFNALDSDDALSHESRLILIKSYFNLKQFKAVLTHTDRLFEEEVFEPEVIKIAAMASQALGHAEKAAIYWEQLYKSDPFKSEAASQLALMYEQTNDFDKAIHWINLALDINPHDANLRSALKRMMGTVSDEKCLAVLIEKISPIAEDEMISIITSALNHHFIISAANSLRKGQDLWPNNPHIKKMTARVSVEWLKHVTDEGLKKTQPEQWLSYLTGLLSIQPRQNTAIRVRREYIVQQRSALKAAYQVGDYDKAIASGITICFLDPVFPGISLLIGRAFYAQKNYVEALTWLIKATDLDNTDKNAWLLRTKAALKAGDILEALSTVRKIQQHFSDELTHATDIKNTLLIVTRDAIKEVNIFIQNDELEHAWHITHALLIDSPEDKKVLKIKSTILRRMTEQLKDAESSEIQMKIARSIQEKDTDNIQALRILAVTLMKQKKHEESLLYWEKLCVLSPEITSYKMQAQKCIKSDVVV